MGEEWRYSWVGESLAGVWWFANIGAVIAVVYSVPWLVVQIVSLFAFHQVWWLGGRLIQRKLPYPETKPEWPGCQLLIVGICAIVVLKMGK